MLSKFVPSAQDERREQVRRPVSREGNRTARTPAGHTDRAIHPQDPFPGGRAMRKHWLRELRTYFVGSCAALAVAAGTAGVGRAQEPGTLGAPAAAAPA